MGDIIAIATAHLGARSREAPLIREGHQDEWGHKLRWKCHIGGGLPGLYSTDEK